MRLYSEKLAQKAIRDILEVIGNRPAIIKYEILDRGDFLFLIIDFSERPSAVDVADWHRKFKEHFSKTLPEPKRGEGYSWMIDMHHQGYPFDTITDDIKLS
jgi:hypothetical protein